MLARFFMLRVFGLSAVLCALVGVRASWAAVGDVGVYVSPPRSFSTTTYWIEGSQGVVLIDTQFLPREGLEALAAAERATGKPVVAALVLHPNPDKFNGTAVLQQRGVKVLTSQQVRDAIPGVHRIRLGWFFDEYAPDYPKDAAQPEVLGDRSTTLALAGVPLRIHVLGRGASAAHLVVQHNEHVFVGDLINPDNHAWLELGWIDDWLQRLAEIAALQPKRVWPGRGRAGGAELIDAQAKYLRDVQQRVRTLRPQGEIGWFTKWRLQSQIESANPQRGYPIFMRDGLPAVWKTEAERR
jgi:glyoxylase-like metal-dependent hydrolase (beta-lactamase superfamily II)